MITLDMPGPAFNPIPPIYLKLFQLYDSWEEPRRSQALERLPMDKLESFLQRRAVMEDFNRRSIRISYDRLRNRDARVLEGVKRGDPLPFSYNQYEKLVDSALAGGTCYHCGSPLTLENFSPDHRIALARGGTSQLSNIRIICWPCNQQKLSSSESIFHSMKARARSLAKRLEYTTRA